MDFLIYSAVLIWVYMTLWYFVSAILKRHDIADIAWGLGFILVAIFNLFTGSLSVQSILLTLLVTVWGSRLAFHIYQRNKNKPEDSRYQQFKSSPYFKVFITQGFFMWLISFPLIFAAHLTPPTASSINFFGIVIWLVGYYFESTGDKELKQFINNPQNSDKIMRSGLWRYTRHPNYFGEVTMWWGVWLLSFSSSLSFFSVIGPLTITTLILFVSGIPMLEKKYEGNVEFEKYKSTTSIFIPWFPKK